MKIWYLKNHGNASDFHTKNGIPSIQSISRVETEQKFIRIIYGSHFHNFVVYLHVSYMKKILCLYLQFATNQQTACRYLKKCALEGLLNTGRYRVIKRLNVIVVYCDVLITIIMPLIIILQRIIFRYSSDVLSKWLK